MANDNLDTKHIVDHIDKKPGTVPSGYHYFPQVFDSQECRVFLKQLHAGNSDTDVANAAGENKWCAETRNEESRSVRHYGGFTGFNFQNRSYDERQKNVNPIHDVLVEMYELIQTRLLRGHKRGYGYKLKLVPNFVSMYLYKPGEGIHQHLDSEDFEMLTLQGTSSLTFTKQDGSINDKDSTYNKFVDSGSVSILTGDARYVWKHGIPKQNHDKDDHGVSVPRVDDRISIVFRRAKSSSWTPKTHTERLAAIQSSNDTIQTSDQTSDAFKSRLEPMWKNEGHLFIGAACWVVFVFTVVMTVNKTTNRTPK